MRIFIAINLPADIKADIYQRLENWRQSNFPIKWVEEENIHLTIKFCHELEAEQIGQLINKIKPEVEQSSAFSIKIKAADYLPPYKPRIIYLTAYADKLNKLANKIISLSDQLSFIEPEKRNWLPHITLGRIKGVLPIAFLQQIKTLRFEYEFKVKSVEVMSSKLTPTGPIYKIEKSILLAC